MITIAILNQKGGVGKTTSTINIAGELAKRQNKVLIVDCDSQGNATSNLGCYKAEQKGISNILLGDVSVNDVIKNTKISNIDLIPSNLELQFAEMSLQQRTTRNDNVLAKAMKEIKNTYDFILFDCPPSLSTITVNVLTYVENVLIPIRDTNSLEGYTRIIDTINVIKEDSNDKLKILGVFISIFEKQTVLDNMIYNECKTSFGNLFFKTVISKNIDVREAPVNNIPVCYYNEKSIGALDYKNLTDEILAKVGK